MKQFLGARRHLHITKSVHPLHQICIYVFMYVRISNTIVSSLSAYRSPEHFFDDQGNCWEYLESGFRIRIFLRIRIRIRAKIFMRIRIRFRIRILGVKGKINFFLSFFHVSDDS